MSIHKLHHRIQRILSNADMVRHKRRVQGSGDLLLVSVENFGERFCAFLDARVPHYVLNLETAFTATSSQTSSTSTAGDAPRSPACAATPSPSSATSLAHADALDCDVIATGHYAVARDGGLYGARTRAKDQSYFLWGIDRAVVARMLDAGRRASPSRKPRAGPRGLDRRLRTSRNRSKSASSRTTIMPRCSSGSARRGPRPDSGAVGHQRA